MGWVVEQTHDGSSTAAIQKINSKVIKLLLTIHTCMQIAIMERFKI